MPASNLRLLKKLLLQRFHLKIGLPVLQIKGLTRMAVDGEGLHSKVTSNDGYKMPLFYGVHLRTKIIENKRQFEVQKLDYPCRNLVIWIWNRNERSRNSIIRTWSYFEQVETIKGKLDIADVEVQITIPTKMQITLFELQIVFYFQLFLSANVRHRRSPNLQKKNDITSHIKKRTVLGVKKRVQNLRH